MYQIWADQTLIYDDTRTESTLRLSSPKLSLGDNSAGSLSITVPPGNAGYDLIEELSTRISVFKDGNEIWEGRMIQERKDFWNNRVLTCEGALAYLNDTIQPQKKISDGSQFPVEEVLKALLAEHNAKVSAEYQFTVGTVTVTAPTAVITLFTNFEKTIEVINSNLINVYGGHLQIRKSGGVRYLDYLSDSSLNMNSQVIEFGKNLMDLTKSTDITDFATVILPLGARKQEKSDDYPDEVEEYVTLKDGTFSDAQIIDTVYVKTADSALYSKYGRIEKKVNFDDVDEDHVADLLTKAKAYLEGISYENLTLEVSAMDLHYTNAQVEPVKIGDKIKVKSSPHGLSRNFPVVKLDIPLDKPEDTKFTLGDTVQVSLTETNNKINSELKAKLEQMPTINKDAILDQAQENAQAIMDYVTNGYITTLTAGTGEGKHSDTLYISEQLYDPTDQKPFGNRYWKWSLSGLGYTDDGGETWKSAILMDGTILGERIAAGSIHGSKITAQTLGLVSAAGEQSCTLSLVSKGLSADDLEIGGINSQYGTNDDYDVQHVRTVGRHQLAAGTKIRVTGYSFDLFSYTGNTYNGWTPVTKSQSDNVAEYTIQQTAEYRLSINYGSVVPSENVVRTIGAAVDLGTATVFSAADIRINGMVTFSALSANDGTTVINGGNIRTGKVQADYINLKGITVTKTISDGGVDREVTTFSVDQNGDVFINGSIALTEDSEITFDTPNQEIETLGDLTETMLEIAEGTYDPGSGITIGGTTYTGSFIKNKLIYGPTIIANEFVAQAGTSTSTRTGSYILRDGNNTDRFRVQYSSDTDLAPAVVFSTASSGAGSVFRFTQRAEFSGGFEDNTGGSSTSVIGGQLTINGKMVCNQGKIIFTYGTTYFSNYSDMVSAIPNPEVGQLCFVLS